MYNVDNVQLTHISKSDIFMVDYSCSYINWIYALIQLSCNLAEEWYPIYIISNANMKCITHAYNPLQHKRAWYHW